MAFSCIKLFPDVTIQNKVCTKNEFRDTLGKKFREKRLTIFYQQFYSSLSYFRPPCPTSVEMVSLSQPSNIISPAPTQQNFLEVLNRFHEQCQPEKNCSTINTADISSNAPTPSSQSFNVHSQTQFPVDHNDQDVQEAVSLLAMLRNSGMSYE